LPLQGIVVVRGAREENDMILFLYASMARAADAEPPSAAECAASVNALLDQMTAFASGAPP
jgi:hypothetical protein